MKCDSPFTVKLTPEASGKHGINHAPVPCGKCYNCKGTRIAQWSFRLQKELEVSTSAYFITLTYDPHHVPIIKGRYPMSLVKNIQQNDNLMDSEGRTDRSLQGFFKRLRYYETEARAQFDPKTKKLTARKPLKYYACGEYGARKRPHYHIILFNLGYVESLIKAWATAVVQKGITIDYLPFGSMDIDPDVNSRNIEYVLKYICKADDGIGKGKNDFRIPEFSLMSKGLGANYLTPSIETFYNRRLDLSYVLNQHGIKIPMPKYYVNKMMTQETKDDRVGYIKRGIEEREALDKTTPEQKAAAKYVRNHKLTTYSKRNSI